ncbi:MAG: hypothetical protein ACLVG5_00380 [Clostridium sp.]
MAKPERRVGGKGQSDPCYSGENMRQYPRRQQYGLCCYRTDKDLSGRRTYIEESILPVLEPVRSVKLVLPKEVPVTVMLPKLKQLEEENPNCILYTGKKPERFSLS